MIEYDTTERINHKYFILCRGHLRIATQKGGCTCKWKPLQRQTYHRLETGLKTKLNKPLMGLLDSKLSLDPGNRPGDILCVR